MRILYYTTNRCFEKGGKIDKNPSTILFMFYKLSIVVLSFATDTLAKAFKPESDFGIWISRSDVVKILVNPKGLTAFLPRIPQNPLITKFYDLKVVVL